MTKFLQGLGLTRDSAIFFYTKIVSLAGLVTTGVLDPAQLGLNEKQKHLVMVACGAIAYLAGQLSTSNLPAKATSEPPAPVGPTPLKAASLLLACALLGSMTACASVPVKQTATVSLQSVETAIGAAQDFERANFAQFGENAPASDTLKHYCPASALPQPLPATATIHQVVSCLFVQAFNSQQASSTALQAWAPGSMPPSVLGDLRGEVDTIVGIVKGLTSNQNQQQMLTLAQGTVDSVLSALQALGISVPSVTPGGVQ